MPSPFPGMDPYLETPALWRGFHNMLITFITEALNRDLPVGYAANYEERVYILPDERTIAPDVAVRRAPHANGKSGNTALLERSAPHGIVSVVQQEEREGFVEIRTGADWEQVVTVIEVLSPTNKTPGEGREAYRLKQRQVMASDTHLLEIDLLHGGTHTVAAPIEALRNRGEWDYLVCLNRSAVREDYEYWMIDLRNALPVVRVPLRDKSTDVELDLQATFARTYDAGPYHRLIDYSSEPPALLTPDKAEWARQVCAALT